MNPLKKSFIVLGAFYSGISAASAADVPTAYLIYNIRFSLIHPSSSSRPNPVRKIDAKDLFLRLFLNLPIEILVLQYSSSSAAAEQVKQIRNLFPIC